MADAALWVLAAEGATGFPEGAFLAALTESQEEIMTDAMANNSLAIALVKIAQSQEFFGTVGELFQRLDAERGIRDKFFPATPAHLSKDLAILRPELPKIGIELIFGPKGRDGKKVHLRLLDPDMKVSKTPPGAIDV